MAGGRGGGGGGGKICFPVGRAESYEGLAGASRKVHSRIRAGMQEFTENPWVFRSRKRTFLSRVSSLRNVVPYARYPRVSILAVSIPSRVRFEHARSADSNLARLEYRGALITRKQRPRVAYEIIVTRRGVGNVIRGSKVRRPRGRANG